MVLRDPKAYALPCADSRMSNDEEYDIMKETIKPNTRYLIPYG